MASVLDDAPGWVKYWGLIQRSARNYGMNPNETLAVHIFEAGEGANPNIVGPVAEGKRAVGLAQIWDETVSSRTNPKGWKQFVAKWGLNSGQVLGDLKRNAEFSIDYLAWRMAGTRDKYETLDSWYKGGYNPGFTSDSRGSGPSFYLWNNPTGTPFPVVGYTLANASSEYGDDRDGGSRLHKGIDVAAPRGTPVVAVADGIARRRMGGPGGNAIWINGKYYYAHLSKFAVSDGQKVKKGDVIGYVGSTGTSSTGPHLHFGIDPKGGFGSGGSWVDPRAFLNGAVGSPGGGPQGDPDLPPETDPFRFMFPDRDAGDSSPGGGVMLPGGGPMLPGGGPMLPGGGPMLPGGGPMLPGSDSGGSGSRSRDTRTTTWQLIADQENAGPDAKREAANFVGSEGA